MSAFRYVTVAALAAIAIYGLLEQARRLILGRISYWLESELSHELYNLGHMYEAAAAHHAAGAV